MFQRKKVIHFKRTWIERNFCQVWFKLAWLFWRRFLPAVTVSSHGHAVTGNTIGANNHTPPNWFKISISKSIYKILNFIFNQSLKRATKKQHTQRKTTQRWTRIENETRHTTVYQFMLHLLNEWFNFETNQVTLRYKNLMTHNANICIMLKELPRA